MDQHHHKMPELFEQLGLPSDPASIKQFIARHRPVDSQVRLFEAAFWNPSQAAFIKEKIGEDSDWVGLIDSLSAALREHPDTETLAAGVDNDPAMQGEGNYAAGKRYDDAAQAFAKSGRVEPAARAAAPHNPAEAQAMREAEAVGLSKAKT